MEQSSRLSLSSANAPSVCLVQGSPTFVKLRATSCVPTNAEGY